EPGDEYDAQSPPVEVSCEIEQVGLHATVDVAERRARADRDDGGPLRRLVVDADAACVHAVLGQRTACRQVRGRKAEPPATAPAGADDSPEGGDVLGRDREARGRTAIWRPSRTHAAHEHVPCLTG